jgi:hypothetical protein
MGRFLFTWVRKCTVLGKRYLTEIVDCATGKEEALRRLAIQDAKHKKNNNGKWQLISVKELQIKGHPESATPESVVGSDDYSQWVQSVRPFQSKTDQGIKCFVNH